MGFPLGTSPCGTLWWVGSIVNETQTFFMDYEKTIQAKTKKMKRPLTESESENEMDENFYQFIVLESIEETPITKLSPFLIQKTIETHCKPINIKKSYEQHHYYTNNKSKTIRKNSKMETIWKMKHKNIPSPNPKLLERSYKIPRPCIVFP